MITVINTIQLPQPVCQEEARRIFLSTAPMYQRVAGLIRKCYVLSEDGSTVGGIYLWRSRAEAEAMYTANWRALVREKYGAEPSIAYFATPVVVDNVTHEVLSDR